MPETLNDADRTFIAHWARAIIKSVFEVGATISAIFRCHLSSHTFDLKGSSVQRLP
jgi:hypothetical protein